MICQKFDLPRVRGNQVDLKGIVTGEMILGDTAILQASGRNLTRGTHYSGLAMKILLV